MKTLTKNLVIVSLVVLSTMLFITGCVTHAEFTTGAAKSGNQAAANINANTPSGDHSTGNGSGGRSARDDR